MGIKWNKKKKRVESDKYPNVWLHIYERNPASVYNWCDHCGEKEDHQIHINWKARGITEEQMRKGGYFTMADEKKITFDSGSKRNQLTRVRYDLISPVALRRLAETYALGAAKYTDRNWELGQPFSVLLNHALDHINEFIALQRGVQRAGDILPPGELQEDHIAHATWNLFALMHFQEVMPEMNDIDSAQAAIKERMLKELPDPALHAFHGDPKLLCQACKKERDDPIHYQGTERSTEGG